MHQEHGKGLLHSELFATLDLVGQAPGGPDADPEGVTLGGWQAPLMDEAAGAKILGAYEGTDALLLGRRTYDIFAAYWPHQDGGEDNEIARLFNSIPKHVASRGGVGKKVFDGGAVPRNVTLLEPPFAGPKGSVFLRDGLAEGTPGTGDMITR